MQTDSVWDSVTKSLLSKNPKLELVSEDLSKGDFDGFEDWTHDFCRRVVEQGSGEKQFLLGYSLGGRLALHACLHRPDLWQGVIVVGADPGTSSEKEKKKQLRKDREWARKLTNQPIEKLIEEWNDQPVFCGLQNLSLRELGYLNAKKISRQFEVFSKGRQRNLVPELSQMRNPLILFVSGEKDEKYSSVGEKLASSCKTVEFKVIPGAGHRVPWENPNEFSLAVCRFIERCVT